MKKIASNELKKFLQDWLSWAEGRESEFDYRPEIGLCTSCIENYGSRLHKELTALFNTPHPFGIRRYYLGMSLYTQHQDPNRLAWVRAALNDTLDTWELME